MRRKVTIARVADIPEGEGRPFAVEGREIAVFNCKGTLHAIADRCTHAEATLHDGSLDRVRCTVECMLHGAEFDLATGEVITPPANDPVETFLIEVEGDEVSIILDD